MKLEPVIWKVGHVFKVTFRRSVTFLFLSSLLWLVIAAELRLFVYRYTWFDVEVAYIISILGFGVLLIPLLPKPEPMHVADKFLKTCKALGLRIKDGKNIIPVEIIEKHRTDSGVTLRCYLPPGLALSMFENTKEAFERVLNAEVSFSLQGRDLVVDAVTGQLPERWVYNEESMDSAWPETGGNGVRALEPDAAPVGGRANGKRKVGVSQADADYDYSAIPTNGSQDTFN